MSARKYCYSGSILEDGGDLVTRKRSVTMSAARVKMNVFEMRKDWTEPCTVVDDKLIDYAPKLRLYIDIPTKYRSYCDGCALPVLSLLDQLASSEAESPRP